MREVSFFKRLKFNFDGSVTKRALVLGDADNDQRNELVCANLQGHLAIFKDRNPDKVAYASNLGMVTACAIGDLINSGGKNFVAAINMEGWLFIFELLSDKETPADINPQQPKSSAKDLKPFYEQRMPANCKELLLADLDGDGQNEVIIGLTDRVLRTYKWVKIGPGQGKFVGLYKWEFADQIGSVSLNPSRHENCQDIVVAQPGGTYAKLECFDKKPLTNSRSPTGSSSEHHQKKNGGQVHKDQVTTFNEKHQLSPENSPDEDNVRTEYVNKLTPEYHQLALSQMRNHHVSTEVLGNIKDGKDSKSYSLIVIATLDGTLMLVNKDEILWSLQVDHQLFALASLESCNNTDQDANNQTESHLMTSNTSNTSPKPCESPSKNKMASKAIEKEQHMFQYFVACAWNGKTYIIDEERNYLRFKFDEAVSAFTAGSYYFDKGHHASLVYATFNNQIIIYYDVLLDNIRPIYLLDEILNNPECQDLIEDLHKLSVRLELLEDDAPMPSSGLEEESALEDHRGLYKVISEILYNITDEEASSLSRDSSR